MLPLAVKVAKKYAPEMTKIAFSMSPRSFDAPLPKNSH